MNEWVERKHWAYSDLAEVKLGKAESFRADPVEATEALMLSRTVMAAVLMGLLATSAISGAQAQQPSSSGQQAANPSGWTFNIAPYMWLPTLRTTLNNELPPALDGRVPTDLSVGPGEILAI
jgi:hypothetical protein